MDTQEKQTWMQLLSLMSQPSIPCPTNTSSQPQQKPPTSDVNPSSVGLENIPINPHEPNPTSEINPSTIVPANIPISPHDPNPTPEINPSTVVLENTPISPQEPIPTSEINSSSVGPRKDVSLNTKNQIAQFLLSNSSGEKDNYGKVKQASEMFGVSKRTIQRVWEEARQQREQGTSINLISHRIGVTRPRKSSVDLEKIRDIPFRKRCTIRRLAKELNVSKSNIGRKVKAGKIKAHTNAIKPTLTDANQVARVNFCLHQLVADPATNTIRFKDMFHVVHIDEKWFYMTRQTERYYVLPGEAEPHRTCQSKRFIPKVMFMCAVSRPMFSSYGEMLFDGKIGIWPFVQEGTAKRNSKNRLKGSAFIKPMDSITKEVTKACLLNQVIPAIKEKWPTFSSKNIIIQQDNAKPHITNDDPDFQAAATSDGFNIQLRCQPPNSPDTNINDLGWFRAIQSLAVGTSSYTIEDIMRNVMHSYENLSPYKLNYVFLTLQTCLVEILKCSGQNSYKIPHMGKAMLDRQGKLPIAIEVESDLVRESINKVLAANGSGQLPYDISPLLSFLGY